MEAMDAQGTRETDVLLKNPDAVSVGQLCGFCWSGHKGARAIGQ